MNIFHKFTRESLKKNKARTIVTIIGIILSAAMVTAVIQAANSGLIFLQNEEIALVGAYHLEMHDLTDEEINEVLNHENVAESTTFTEVGWADIGSTNPDKPYLLIESMADNFTDLVAVNLTSGRMPEKEDEILLPAHLNYNGGVEHRLGDELSLKVGKRVSTGDCLALGCNNPYTYREEELIDVFSKKYQVVGFYDRFYMDIEPYICPGYTALTVGGGTGAQRLFIRVQKPQKAYEMLYSDLNNVMEKCKPHDELIRLSGTFRNGAITEMLYGIVIFLVLLIGCGSVLLIYNSFSISVSERTKQFGILKSVGATKKQIRHSVLYEAFLLCLIGIPLGLLFGCVGIGVTFWCLKDAFASIMGTGTIPVEMKLAVSVPGLAVAAIVCLITTLISAWIPARRAIKVSAIESIRLSNDVTVKGKEVRTWKLTQKVFGFEGMMAAKNFKRNKKRYRTTIISLFLSVTLFISASSLCAYISHSVTGFTAGRIDADMVYCYTPDEGSSDYKEVFELLSSVEGVTKAEYVSERYLSFQVEEKYYSEQYKKNPYYERERANEENQYAFLLFLDDKTFDSMCEKAHLNKKEYYNVDAPLALMYNQGVFDYQDDDGKWKRFTYDLLNASALQQEFVMQGQKWFEDLSTVDEKITMDENGVEVYTYYPTDHVIDYLNERISQLDATLAVQIPVSEINIEIPIKIGAYIDEVPLMLSRTHSMMIYPDSMKAVIMKNADFGDSEESFEYGFKVKDHKSSYAEMKSRLTGKALNVSDLTDYAERVESERMLVTVINVFSYGFIVLISLIALANVFNTIYTNISLRRREFAMLRSVGLTGGGLQKMMNYECIIYGCKGLLWGLPASFLATYAIWRAIGEGMDQEFFVPWYSVVIAVGSVFLVVFATMLYAMSKIKADNTIDALKNENL